MAGSRRLSRTAQVEVFFILWNDSSPEIHTRPSSRPCNGFRRWIDPEVVLIF
jgi:hypothetical protein